MLKPPFKKIITFILVLSFLLQLLNISINVKAEASFIEKKITNIEGLENYNPKIYGNKVVWIYYDDEDGTSGISMYNIDTEEVTQISTSSDECEEDDLVIYGNKIFWTDDRTRFADIYMYDIETAQETQITSNIFNETDLAVYENKLIWRDDRNLNYDIFLYDIETEEETQITSSIATEQYLSIYDNKIVWGEREGLTYQFFLFNLDTEEETQITSTDNGRYGPILYGNKIYWTENSDETPSIYMYDIDSETESQLITGLDSYNSLKINENFIVWYSDSEEVEQIFMYNILTSETVQITSHDFGGCDPDVYQDKVVWIDYRNTDDEWNFTDIYMATSDSFYAESFSPSNESNNVSISDDLLVTFNEEVYQGVGDIVIKNSDDDSIFETINVLSNQISGWGTDSISIALSDDLIGYTDYYVLIDSTAIKNSEDDYYAGISSSTSWNFTTGADKIHFQFSDNLDSSDYIDITNTTAVFEDPDYSIYFRDNFTESSVTNLLLHSPDIGNSWSSMSEFSFKGDVPPIQSYHISQLNELGNWEEKYISHYDVNYQSKDFLFSKVFGYINLKIEQKNSDFADVEQIKLIACGQEVSPNYARYMNSGENILDVVLQDDFNVTDAHENPIIIQYSIPDSCNEETILSLKAHEYNGTGNNFRYPLGKSYYKKYTFDNKKTIIINGDITEVDKIEEPDVIDYWVAGTGHPSSNTYMYLNDDDENFYFSADITLDNSSEDGYDWAELELQDVYTGEISNYKITDYDDSWGLCGFGLTSKVSYNHQYCEFKIPKTEISGNSINYAFKYYGTASPLYSAFINNNQLTLEEDGVDNGFTQRANFDLGAEVPSDYVVSADIVKIGGVEEYISLLARVQDNDRFYAFIFDNQNGYIVEVYDGYLSYHSDAMTPPEEGDTVSLSVNGSTISVYYNGILQESAEDTSFSSAGNAGIGFGAITEYGSLAGSLNSETQTIDNFIVSSKVPGLVDNLATIENENPGWTNADGTTIGAELISNEFTSSFSSKMILDSNDNPMFLYEGRDKFSNCEVRFTRWNGEAWTNGDGETEGFDILSEGSCIGNDSEILDMQLDSGGYPHLLWGNTDENSIYYSRWNGEEWTKANLTATGTEKISSDSNVSYSGILRLTQDDAPVIVWVDNNDGENIAITKWTGSEWAGMDEEDDYQTLLSGDYPQFELDSNDYPVISYSHNNRVFLTRWDGDDSWGGADFSFGNDELSAPDCDYCYQTSLIINDTDNIYVAWQRENNLSKFTYWNGTGWYNADGITSGSEEISGISDPSVIFDYNGNPIIYGYYNDTYPDIEFTRWNNNGWFHADGETPGIENVASTNENILSKLNLISSEAKDKFFGVWSIFSPSSTHFTMWNGESWVYADGETEGEERLSDESLTYYSDVLLSSDESYIFTTWYDNDDYSMYFSKHNIYLDPSATIQSTKINTSTSTIEYATLVASSTTPGASRIEYFLSNNGGEVWEGVAPGVEHTFITNGNDLRWRAILYRGSVPTLSSVSINYAVTPPYTPTPTPTPSPSPSAPMYSNPCKYRITIDRNSITTLKRDVEVRLEICGDVENVSLSENKDFNDEIIFDYEPFLGWTLSKGNGEKTIYARFHQSNGYITKEEVFDAIYLLEEDKDDQKGEIIKEEVNYKNEQLDDEVPLDANVTIDVEEEEGEKEALEPIQAPRTKIEIKISMRRGSNNQQVKDLETILKEMKYLPEDHTPNELFDTKTEEAVNQFQKDHGINPCGIVGPRTARALNSENYYTDKEFRFTRDLRYNDTGEDVKQLQTRLQDRNFFPFYVQPTYWFGPVTQTAVYDFQKAYQIDGKGVVGEKSREELNKSY